MTAQEIAYTCLEYIGEFSMTFAEYVGEAGTGVRRALVRSQNRALEEIFRLNPRCFKRPVGVQLHAPIAGTVDVTQGSHDVTNPTFAGSPVLASNTIAIAGQTEYNSIRTEGAGTKLLFPYSGTTGTQAATLYGDAVLLDAGYSRPIGPVWLPNRRMISTLNGTTDYLGYDPRQNYNTDWGFYSAGLSFPTSPTINEPTAYLAESHIADAGNASRIRLFFSPIPDRAYPLVFEAGVRPLVVADADLGSEGSDPGRTFAMVGGMDADFLLPVVLWFWSQSAFFKDEASGKKIAANYEAIVPAIEAWKEQPSAAGIVVTRGWKG